MRFRFPLPSLADLFAAAAVVWLLASSAPGSEAGLLQDGDTGVHIRTGLLILETGRIPAADPYSWTRAGEPWIAWEWLSDVLFALLYRAGGLAAVIAACALVIAATAAILLRRIASTASNAVLALVLASLLLGVAQTHLLARPHVFTLLFLALSMAWIDSGRRWWRLPLLTLIWVNLHGGVFALFAVLALYALGALIEGRASEARRMALTLLLCLAASLANPFGWRLHRHVAEYMTAGWIRENVAEFRPPDLASASSICLEAVLFASLLAVAGDLARRRYSRVLLLAAWGHMALASARHVPLFAVIAAPVLAEGAGAAWRALAAHPLARTLDAIGADHLPSLLRHSVWAPALAVLACAIMPVAADYPSSKYPVEVVRTRAADLEGTRLFTTDEWADYIVFRLHPRARVFLDGRSDFFGPAIVEDYKRVLSASAGWQDVLARYGVDAVLLPSGSEAAAVLGQTPAWRLIEDSGGAALYKLRRGR